MLSHNKCLETEFIEDEIIAIYGWDHHLDHPIPLLPVFSEKLDPAIQIKSNLQGWVRNIINEAFR